MNFRKRESLGIEIFRHGGVRQTSESSYEVKSVVPGKTYQVGWNRNRWECTCLDYSKHGSKKCKHIFAAVWFLASKNVAVDDPVPSSIACPSCNKEDVKPKGFRYNRFGRVQTYYCPRCKKRFTPQVLRGTNEGALIVSVALDLYFKGASLRDSVSHIKTYWRRNISHSTLLRWIRRFTVIAEAALEPRGKVRVKTMNVDETFVRLRGKHVVFWTGLDAASRYRVALEVSRTRSTTDALKFLRKAAKRTKGNEELVTDGLESYSKAAPVAFRLRPFLHIQGPGLLSPARLSNNIVESAQSAMKSRTRGIRSFRSMESAKAFASGHRVVRNNFQGHRALHGQTPAQVLGVQKEKLSWKDALTGGGFSPSRRKKGRRNPR